MSNAISIAIMQAKQNISPNDDLVTQLKSAMSATKNHWLVTSENDRFLAAVGAVMEFHGQDSLEWKQLEAEIKNMQKISAALIAAQNGITLDWAALVDEIPETPVIGLQNLWREVTK